VSLGDYFTIETCEPIKQGCLADVIRADQSENVPLLQIEMQAIECNAATEVDAD
jgi:hypothetical protein